MQKFAVVREPEGHTSYVPESEYTSSDSRELIGWVETGELCVSEEETPPQ